MNNLTKNLLSIKDNMISGKSLWLSYRALDIELKDSNNILYLFITNNAEKLYNYQIISQVDNHLSNKEKLKFLDYLIKLSELQIFI